MIAVKGAFMQHARHWIGGEWLDGAGDLTDDSLNPATGGLVGRYAVGGEAEVAAATAAARQAFEQGAWSASPRRRAAALLAMADAFEARRADLTDLAVAESGKLRSEVGHEISAAISECRYYAGLARAIFGRVSEIDEGAMSIFAREPAGVAGIIVPWNAPITLLVRSLAPALAAGCTSVIKPAPQTSLTNALMMEMFAAIDALPPGVVNAVNENGSAVGKALVASEAVDVISFTGSCATGKRIMAAASGTLKRLSLELGGKSPSVVFPDAEIDKAVPVIARCATVMAGQMCTAISRVLVHDTVFDTVKNALAQTLDSLVVGPGEDPASAMGPMVDQVHRDRILGLVDQAGDEGGLVVRGTVPDHLPAGGAFIRPSLAVIDDLTSNLIQEELFGPLLVLERFGDDSEAVMRANATRYGLAASIWTRDLGRAQRVARALRFGTVWLNSHNRLFAEAETGGYKQSGFGRLHGLEGLNDFLETKHIYSETDWLAADGSTS